MFVIVCYCVFLFVVVVLFGGVFVFARACDCMFLVVVGCCCLIVCC